MFEEELAMASDRRLGGSEVVPLLDGLYPRVKTPLRHSTVFQLLIATILSAQCTDAQVNKVTPKLFARFPDARSMSKASVRELEGFVRSTGFFRVKARRIKEVSQKVMSDFGGRVPDSMEKLLTLPGVGRKTANVVLSAGYDKTEGIVVDTHVFRVSRRIGLTSAKTPRGVEEDLMACTPREEWARLSMLLIFHGRAVCDARRPRCEACDLRSRCAYFLAKR